MADLTDALVTVRNITKRFGDRAAVDGISFDIIRGEIFGLLGPNGAGKSTYLRPDSGEITIACLPASDGMADKHRIGVVPQELALYDDLTALQNVDFFARMWRS